VLTQLELLDVGAEKFVPRSFAPKAVSKDRSSFIFQTWRLEPATDVFRPITRKLLDFSRRRIRFAFAPATEEGAVVVERTTFAVPPAALAADEVIVRPVAVRATAAMMDERRRTQNSCGWSDMDNPSKTGLLNSKQKVQTPWVNHMFC
jgi:hypothetical protein